VLFGSRRRPPAPGISSAHHFGCFSTALNLTGSQRLFFGGGAFIQLLFIQSNDAPRPSRLGAFWVHRVIVSISLSMGSSSLPSWAAWPRRKADPFPKPEPFTDRRRVRVCSLFPVLTVKAKDAQSFAFPVACLASSFSLLRMSESAVPYPLCSESMIVFFGDAKSCITVSGVVKSLQATTIFSFPFFVNVPGGVS